jgi:hypothetical protein
VFNFRHGLSLSCSRPQAAGIGMVVRSAIGRRGIVTANASADSARARWAR